MCSDHEERQYTDRSGKEVVFREVVHNRQRDAEQKRQHENPGQKHHQQIILPGYIVVAPGQKRRSHDNERAAHKIPADKRQEFHEQPERGFKICRHNVLLTNGNTFVLCLPPIVFFLENLLPLCMSFYGGSPDDQ